MTSRLPSRLILGAELHNSSSSTERSIRAAFRTVADLGADTVLAPVSWALLEPQEGAFDFRLVDAMLAAAEEEDLAVIPLWFASWKNATSSYAPGWVKVDPARFPRARTAAGPVEHLSPFGAASRSADAAAFAALMNRLSGAGERIPMVQVENELGLLGDSRDRSELAAAAFESSVPAAVTEAVSQDPELALFADWRARGSRNAGTWTEVFGEGLRTDEAFMATAYAGYVDAVAAAGRAEFDVPLYINAWLDSELDLPPLQGDSSVALAGGQRPGTYPSGSPLPQVAAIWKALAPQIDMIAPDIYFGSFDDECRRFSEVNGGKLFIPEMRRSALGVAQMFRAVGEHRAIGVSPFGVDSLHPDDPDRVRLQDAYRLLRAAAGASGREHLSMRGFVLDEEAPADRMVFGDVVVSVSTADPIGYISPSLPAYGIVVEEAPGRLLVAGRGFTVSFASAGGDRIGILSATELEPGNESDPVRELGGDETGGGSGVRFPALDMRQSDVFPIPVTIRTTGLVRIELYRY